mgnify:CR=1 FL=1
MRTLQQDQRKADQQNAEEESGLEMHPKWIFKISHVELRREVDGAGPRYLSSAETGKWGVPLRRRNRKIITAPVRIPRRPPR